MPIRFGMASPAASRYNRYLNLPGGTGSFAEMINAMSTAAGLERESLITCNSDPIIEKIVRGWRNR